LEPSPERSADFAFAALSQQMEGFRIWPLPWSKISLQSVGAFSWFLASRFVASGEVSMNERFDAIIVGTGQAAKPLAGALAKAGKKTASIETKHVGGTCVNEGCTPTKTMVASGRVAYLARRGADYGVRTAPISIDLTKVRQRKRDVVESFRSGNEKRLAGENLELIYGFAHFTGPKTLSIDLRAGGTRTLEADWIFLNTGLRAAIPNIDGIHDVPSLTNESIMELDAVPEHLVILGGGYVGLEFGQMFRRFGSRVTIIHHGKQLLNQEDADVAEEVKKILTEDGIEILLEAETTSARKAADSIQLTVKHRGETRIITGSHLLIAAGRIPNTDALNLPATGVAADPHGYIKVNEYLETNAPGVYALGDVKGGPAFTHISYDDYRVVAGNLLNGQHRSIRDRILPYTVFMDPQLGRIGLTESEARRQGRKIRVAKMPMTYVARAIETAETRGFMKIIVDTETEVILGAAVLGIEGGEIATMVQIAMQGGLKYTALRDGIFSHPTLAESLNNVFFSWTDEN
jgi:pyruvate/2-oxoglutarate dehydrogenase complex dihydrolipoamide dehydrogenase (E3) component